MRPNQFPAPTGVQRASAQGLASLMSALSGFPLATPNCHLLQRLAVTRITRRDGKSDGSDPRRYHYWMAELTKKELQVFRKTLEERREELLKVHAASAGSRAPVELDQTTQGRLSRMDALQVQAMALETDRRRELEVQRIEQALKRIGDGEFGYCITCGDEIERKRLDHDASVPTCVGCAR